MRKLLLALACVLSLSATAQACDQESITSKSDDGSIVVLLNGHVWQINSMDQITTALWLPVDDVLECDYELIHMDDGEKAAGRRLR